MTMLWHILRFDMAHLDGSLRQSLEQRLRTLADIPQVRWLLLGRDVENDGVTGLILLLDDLASLAQYRVHPVHLAVVQELKRAGATNSGLDLLADMDSSLIPGRELLPPNQER